MEKRNGKKNVSLIRTCVRRYIRMLDMNNSIGLGPYSKDAFVHMLRYTRPVRGFATANCVHRTISTGNKIRDTDGAWLHSTTFTCVASIYIGPRYFQSNRYRGQNQAEIRKKEKKEKKVMGKFHGYVTLQISKSNYYAFCESSQL